MSGKQQASWRVCAVLASLIAAAGVSGAQPSGADAESGSLAPAQAEPAPIRARGLARFESCVDAHVRGLPECVRAPAPGAPVPACGPIGILLEDPTPVAACFDPDFPPSMEVIDAVNHVMERMAVEADGFSNRFVVSTSWPGADNSPLTLTWSFVPDGVSIPAGITGDTMGPSQLFAQMDAKFAAAGGRDVWIAQFEAVFARWSALTGINYQRVTTGGNPWDDGAGWSNGGSPGLRGDIRIGMKPIDGAYGVLAYNGYPTSGDMVLDSAENWASPGSGFRFLRNTIAHEHGHGLGLAHVCPINNTKLMEPYLATVFDGPQQDEIRAAQHSYGDPYEPNSTPATATNLGPLAPGATLNPSVLPAPAVANTALTSIGIDNDLDHYLFTATSPLVVTITATPVGSNYADYVQDAACNNSTVNTNSLNQGDLAFDLLNSGGAVVATASVAGFGASERIAGYLLNPGVNYYVKVREVNTLTETQLYTLTIAGAAEPFSASDGAFTDKVRLAWSPILGATNYAVHRGTTSSRAEATLLTQVGAAGLQVDDTAAQPGVTYYYWLEAITSGIAGLRAAAGPETGFRGAPLANDACAGALPIVPGSPAAISTTQASTDGPAETLCLPAGAGTIGSDVWFAYTPAGRGAFTVTTCGSLFDTRLAVYAGACPGTADSAIACNDDASAPPCAGTQSRVRVAGVGGQSYRIRVGGTGSAAGVGQVQVFCAPDFDLSGGVGVSDIFSFLTAYFNGEAAADYSGEGSVSVQDIFDFLASYFGGC